MSVYGPSLCTNYVVCVVTQFKELLNSVVKKKKNTQKLRLSKSKYIVLKRNFVTHTKVSEATKGIF